jgi:hypothetical protein
MVQLYARNITRLDLTSTSDAGSLFTTIEASDDDAVQYGYDWNNNNAIIFDGTGLTINNTLFTIGTTYTIRFNIKYKSTTPHHNVYLVIYDNSTDLNMVTATYTLINDGVYEFTFDNVQGSTIGFKAIDSNVSIYDIDISKGDSISYYYTELDIKGDEEIVFNKALKDIRTPDKTTGEYTKPFMIPITKNNAKFFDNIQNNDASSEFEVGRSIGAVISVDGLNQLEGKLELIKISTNNEGSQYFNVIFYATQITLFQTLSDNLLTSLDTTDLPIKYTAEHIKDTVTTAGVYDGVTAAAAGQEYQFGYIERGENHNSLENKPALTENSICDVPNLVQNSLPPVTGCIEDSFIPGLFNPYIFKQIHEAQGYTVAGDILDDKAFQDLIVPLNCTIASDSGLEVEDHCLIMNAVQTFSRSVQWNTNTTEQELFTIGQSSNGLNLEWAGGSYSRFVPPNPVRANTTVNIKIDSIATVNPNNRLIGPNPAPDPEDRELSKFGVKFRFVLHPIQTWGPTGNNSTDLSIQDGNIPMFVTENIEDFIFGDGEASASTSFDIGKLLYYASNYYSNDNMPKFVLKLYYEEFYQENGDHTSELDDYLETFTIITEDAFDDYYSIAQTLAADAIGSYTETDILNYIAYLLDEHGKTPPTAQAIFNWEKWRISTDAELETAHIEFTSIYNTARSNYLNQVAEWNDDWGMSSNDRMEYDFTVTTDISTEPETTDVLLPFGKTISDPIKHVSGEISQMDYVKNIMNMFNLMVVIDDNTKTITYNKWDDFFVDDFNDYTHKIILDSQIEKKYVNNTIPRFMDFKFEELKFDSNTIDYHSTYDDNPTLYTHDSYNMFRTDSVTNHVKSKHLFNEDISLNFEHTDQLSRIAALRNASKPDKRVDNWGFDIMFWNKQTNTYNNNIIKLNSWDLSDTAGENYFDDYPLYSNDINTETGHRLINSFNVPNQLYTSLNPTRYNTWITDYWKGFLTSINSQQSFMITASFFLTSADYYDIKMNNRIKIGNELYFINSIKDWNATTPTKMELIKFIYNDAINPTHIVKPPLPWDVNIIIKPFGISGSTSLGRFNNSILSSRINVISGTDNTIESSNKIIISGSNNEVINSSNISILDNASNVTVTNSSDLIIRESNVTYIDGLKILEIDEPTETIINSGGSDSIQDEFTDAGIIDNGEDSTYNMNWIESYRLEDGGKNKV